MNTNAVMFRTARPEDVATCVLIRGQTRENAVSEAELNAAGITREFWAEGVKEGHFPGVVAEVHGQVVGYCFGASETGEIVVLALLPDVEGRGVGKVLLRQVMEVLRGLGHQRLFLGCNSDPAVRSHGFYRHLGWKSTGQLDKHGDEVLEYTAPTISV